MNKLSPWKTLYVLPIDNFMPIPLGSPKIQSGGPLIPTTPQFVLLKNRWKTLLSLFLLSERWNIDFFTIYFFSCDELHIYFKRIKYMIVYVFLIELKSESGSDFAFMVTLYNVLKQIVIFLARNCWASLEFLSNENQASCIDKNSMNSMNS